MFYTISSILILLGIVIFLVVIIVIVLSYMISTLIGQPFVPTSKKDMNQILNFSNLQEGTKMLELGCGDGRFLAYTVDNIGVKGTGVEFNPLLVLVANIRGFVMRLKDYKIILGDLRKLSYKEYEAIYLFLFPSTIEQIQDKFLKECKSGTVIISHGFVVPSIHKHLVNALPGNGFKTYLYKLP